MSFLESTDGRGIKHMEQGMRIGNVWGTPIVILNGGVWLDLIKKLTCDHRVQGDELVGLVESWGTSVLARVCGGSSREAAWLRGGSRRRGPRGPGCGVSIRLQLEWLQLQGRQLRVP